ncbi:hypothetical protein BLOT_007118, partial [Blomia tropicalis]
FYKYEIVVEIGFLSVDLPFGYDLLNWKFVNYYFNDTKKFFSNIPPLYVKFLNDKTIYFDFKFVTTTTVSIITDGKEKQWSVLPDLALQIKSKIDWQQIH